MHESAGASARPGAACCRSSTRKLDDEAFSEYCSRSVAGELQRIVPGMSGSSPAHGSNRAARCNCHLKRIGRAGEPRVRLECFETCATCVAAVRRLGSEQVRVQMAQPRAPCIPPGWRAPPSRTANTSGTCAARCSLSIRLRFSSGLRGRAGGRLRAAGGSLLPLRRGADRRCAPPGGGALHSGGQAGRRRLRSSRRRSARTYWDSTCAVPAACRRPGCHTSAAWRPPTKDGSTPGAAGCRRRSPRRHGSRCTAMLALRPRAAERQVADQRMLIRCHPVTRTSTTASSGRWRSRRIL